MNKKTSQIPVALAALLLLVALVVLIAYIIPQITTLRDLNQSVVQKEQELAVGKQKVQAIRDAVQLIQQAKKEVEVLGIAIPTKEKAEESLLQIANIASRQEITVKTATFSSAEGSLTMNVTAEGDYNKFIDFFNDVNSNIRPVVASDINFSPNEETGSLEASFDVSFPYLEEDPKVVATDEATDEGGIDE